MNNILRSGISLLILVLLCGLPEPGAVAAAEKGQPAAPEALAGRLQNLYSSLSSLTFAFSQVTRTGGRERTGAGNALFYRVGGADAENSSSAAGESGTRSIMRWNYHEPDRQVIINDGETLSIYTEKDRQLIRTPASELEADITYAFFSGSRDLLDDFEALEPVEEDRFPGADKLDTLLLIPRQPHNQIRSVQLWFDDQGVIHHLLLADHFDSTTELTFSDIQLNSLPPNDPAVIDRIVALEVPPDTETIVR